jgi:SAM-dependent methyltransferase
MTISRLAGYVPPLSATQPERSVDRTQKILNGLDVASMSGVEIGPLAWPVVRKSDGDITYVDFADAETLRENHRAAGRVPIAEIVEVDAIWGVNTLQQAIGESRKVDYVIASHVVEHVPDLLGWLKELSAVLKPGGEIRLVVPDRRFTFDYIRHETQASQVLAAHLLGARVPQTDRVLDFFLNYVDVDRQAAWDGKLGDLIPTASVRRGLALAEKVANGEYVDVHCWVFTPRSLGALFARLAEDGFIDLECTHFEDTARGDYEFFIGLRPCADAKRVAQSWNRLVEQARDDRGGKAQLAETQAQLQQALLANESLRGELDAVRASFAMLTQRADDLERQVAAIRQSTSWRVTRPLRAVSRKLRNR